MATGYKNDDNIDELNNPAERLRSSEENAAFDNIADDYDKMSADPSQENENISKANKKFDDDNNSGKNIDKARDGENNFSSNVSHRNAGNKQKMSFQNFAKKYSKNGVLPSSVVIIGLITGIFGIGGMGLNSLMLVHLKENFTGKFDTQNTSMQLRTERMWAKKMAGDNTKGDCKITKVLCRYSKPSGHMLKQLKKNGVLALDKNGKVIKHKKLWPDKRPAKYVFQNGMNGLKTVDAKDFTKELKDNPKFRAKFRGAYNPRWVGFADSVFRKVSAKFSISKDQGKLKAKNAKSLKENLGKGRGGRTGGVEKGSGTKGFDRVATENLGKVADTLKAAGRGGMASMAVGAGCVLADVPSFISSISRGLQMTQLVQYAFPFLSVADTIKYGDGDTKDIGLIGDLLTTNVDGKSAMDSYGMKYALFGDTAPQNNNYKKFIAGGGELATKSNEIDGFLGGQNRKELCSKATSPEGAAAIAGGWAFLTGATGGTALIAAVINYGIGLGLAKTLDLIAEPIIKGFVALIPDSVKESAIKFLVGDITENLSGESVGDALVSGSANMMAQTANTGGNAPLSVDQAIAYQKGTDQVELAYAEEVRATHSPLDASTKYTFMGSIVDNVLPYYGTINNASNILSTIGGVTARSLGSIFNVHAAENNKAEYESCDIPSIKDADVAAGPFCNIIYGVPLGDLESKDPDDVAQYMIDNKYINEEGEIKEKSDYKNWLDMCVNGDPDYAASCQIKGETKEMYSNFAIYTIDSRIQKSMDDPEETKPQNVGGGDSSGDDMSGGNLPTGTTKELAKKIYDSPNIQFQTGAGKTAFKRIVDTGKASTCGSPTISPLMLGMILSASEKFKLTLGVLTDGHGCGSPNHNSGQGIDINGIRKASDSFQQQFHWSGKKDGENARDFIKYMDGIGEPGRVNFGQIGCWGSTGVSAPSIKNGIMFSDACNHLHMDVRKR